MGQEGSAVQNGSQSVLVKFKFGNLNAHHHGCKVLIQIDELLTFTKFANSPNYKSY